MAPYPIKRLMHEVGPLASQMLSMQVYLKGAPAGSLLGRLCPFMRNSVNGALSDKKCDAEEWAFLPIFCFNVILRAPLFKF
jgi:hypothetical protein